MNTPGHDELCACDECLRHEFLEQCRTKLCHLCLRPREHWTHQPKGTPPAPRKPWASRLTSAKRSTTR